MSTNCFGFGSKNDACRPLLRSGTTPRTCSPGRNTSSRRRWGVSSTSSTRGPCRRASGCADRPALYGGLAHRCVAPTTATDDSASGSVTALAARARVGISISSAEFVFDPGRRAIRARRRRRRSAHSGRPSADLVSRGQIVHEGVVVADIPQREHEIALDSTRTRRRGRRGPRPWQLARSSPSRLSARSSGPGW